MKRAYLVFLTVAGSIVILGFLNTLLGAENPDEKLEQAKLQYEQALRGHCSIIGSKTENCYSDSDESKCEDLNKSIEWFMSANGYGQPPEVACRKKPNLG